MEKIIELLVPGRSLYIYGGEKHGVPLEPILVNITGHRLDRDGAIRGRQEAEKVEDEMKRNKLLAFYSTTGEKVLANIHKEPNAYVLEMELSRLKKKATEEMKRYLSLRERMKVPTFIDNISEPEEVELYNLHIKLNPEGRYSELERQGVVLRKRNMDCENALELEFLKLHRKMR